MHYIFRKATSLFSLPIAMKGSLSARSPSSSNSNFTISQTASPPLLSQELFRDIDKEYHPLEQVLNTTPSPQLPYVLDTIYKDVINRCDIREKAGNIPYALEHFFLYYLSILYADVNSNDIPWHDLHGNLTLGKLPIF